MQQLRNIVGVLETSKEETEARLLDKVTTRIKEMISNNNGNDHDHDKYFIKKTFFTTVLGT